MATFLKTTQIPTGGAYTLPREYFTSPEIHEAERERIFARRWLCVGREAQLAAAGDYVLVDAAGESVIVLRDRAGAVRAFYNVCRHRGARLCEAERGTLGGTIQCPYHAWTYALDGRLVGAPSHDEFDALDKANFPLHPVAVAAWEGWLFINLAGADAEPFERAWAPLIGKFSRFNLASLVAARRVEYDVAANWKLVVQNYSECYHCAPVHPELVKLSPATSGENDLVSGPFLGGFMTLAKDGGSMTESGRACGVAVAELPAEDHRRVYYYSLFPNVLLSLHPDYVMCHTLWPQGPARTRVVCEWLFHPATLDPSSGFDPDDGVRFWDTTNRQDWHVCELSQQGVSSRAYRPGPYSRRESLSVAFDREVLEALRG